MDVRDHLHQLVDELPEAEIPAAQRFLQYLHEVHDPIDHEPLSDETIEAIREGEEAMKRGEFITLEEYRRTRGL